jgi:murein DD-endopeptidase MepM/ murein hydrolase activator NlpD
VNAESRPTWQSLKLTGRERGNQPRTTRAHGVKSDIRPGSPSPNPSAHLVGDWEIHVSFLSLRAVRRRSAAAVSIALALSTAVACYPASRSGVSWPLLPQGVVSQGFGGGHSGLDIAGPYGAPVLAATEGRVTQAGPWYGYGNYICIQRAVSFKTCYAHLSNVSVRPGQSVFRGMVIGNEGSTGDSTGAHLMFEVYENGRAVNPFNYL